VDQLNFTAIVNGHFAINTKPLSIKTAAQFEYDIIVEMKCNIGKLKTKHQSG
jgi:hypothetical protein